MTKLILPAMTIIATTTIILIKDLNAEGMFVAGVVGGVVTLYLIFFD